MNNSKKEKAVKPKYNMWQCSAYMISTAWKEREKKVIVFCTLQAILAVASNLVNLYISPMVLSMVEKGTPASEFILTVISFTLLIMLLSAATGYVNTNKLYGKITVRSAIIAAINRKSCKTSYPNTVDDRFIKLRAKSGEAVAGNSGSGEAIWNTLTLLLQNVLGFAVYMIMLFNVELWIVMLIIATTMLGYFIQNKLNGYGYRHRDEEAEMTRKIWYDINLPANYSGAKDIRIFGMKPWFDELRNKTMNTYIAFHKRAEGIYIWASITDIVLTFLRNALVYAYLIYLVLNDTLSVPEFVLYFSAVGGFTSWVSGILGNLSTLYRQSLDISTIRELIEYPENFKFEDGKSINVEPNKKYEIKLENVSFKYPSADKNTLEKINLTLNPGEKLAIVGLNGAGKSTLIKLMCGFFDPTEGRVLLDGVDIREYNRRDYYAMFSAVFQDFSLLAGSVATNVAQTEEHINMKYVKECVEKAGLTKKIESLKEKYETMLNRKIYEDGAELSGGELQRLMLARALYKKAPFMVLDEPTAALDPIAEADIYNKYNEMTAGCSSVYISHRLASTRFCDRIILIGESKIIEEGTHSELIKLGGKYAEMFEVQSKYYREGEAEHE